MTTFERRLVEFEGVIETIPQMIDVFDRVAVSRLETYRITYDHLDPHQTTNIFAITHQWMTQNKTPYALHGSYDFHALIIEDERALRFRHYCDIPEDDIHQLKVGSPVFSEVSLYVEDLPPTTRVHRIG